MDLSAYSFIVGFVPENLVGRYFQLVASLESFSALIGIALLYPIYQWGLAKGGCAGGSAYYICAVRALIPQFLKFRLTIAVFIRDCSHSHLAIETSQQDNTGRR